MRTIQIQAYKFSELSEEAQIRASSWYLEGMDTLLDQEYNEDLLIENGFLNPRIRFSGFGSQGDGASFIADIDTKRFLVGKYEALKEVEFKLCVISINSRYCHEKTARVESFISDVELTGEESELITELGDEIEQIRLELCHKIYANLKADYEYQTSYDCIAENIEANGYEFDDTGRII